MTVSACLRLLLAVVFAGIFLCFYECLPALPSSKTADALLLCLAVLARKPVWFASGTTSSHKPSTTAKFRVERTCRQHRGDKDYVCYAVLYSPCDTAIAIDLVSASVALLSPS